MQSPSQAFYIYIFTNTTRDKFVTGYTVDLLQTLKQFHHSGYRNTYLDENKQDCFLLVFFERFEEKSRAYLESTVLEALSEKALKHKIVAFNPEWKHLNIELINSEPGTGE